MDSPSIHDFDEGKTFFLEEIPLMLSQFCQRCIDLGFDKHHAFLLTQDWFSVLLRNSYLNRTDDQTC